MRIESIATVIPVANVADAAAAWQRLLGVAPSFVDGDRWAQFDIAGSRFALAGRDRTSDRAGLMVKVIDLDAACAAATAQGAEVTPIEVGPHERRATVTGPEGLPVVLYSPTA